MPQGHDEHAERQIQRPLQLTTPQQKGPDVRELEDSMNKLYKDWGVHRHVEEDGDFDPATKRHANRVLYLLGVDPQGSGPAGPVFTQEEQRYIRDPSSRNDNQRERGKNRVEDELAKQERAKGGAQRAVQAALSKKGVHEEPPGSNRGPFVDMVTRFCSLTPPVFWCGCFTGWAACSEEGGNANADPWAMVHHAVMLSYARQGLHGLEDVSLSEARAGDIVSYSFEHIGMLVEPISGGRLHTIEGNTGQQGLQNNGGGVYEHSDRTTGLVLGISRPDYA